jgi:hypothetical protein
MSGETPQMSGGTPQMSGGTPQKSGGTPQTSGGTPQYFMKTHCNMEKYNRNAKGSFFFHCRIPEMQICANMLTTSYSGG